MIGWKMKEHAVILELQLAVSTPIDMLTYVLASHVKLIWKP